MYIYDIQLKLQTTTELSSEPYELLLIQNENVSSVNVFQKVHKIQQRIQVWKGYHANM